MLETKTAKSALDSEAILSEEVRNFLEQEKEELRKCIRGLAIFDGRDEAAVQCALRITDTLRYYKDIASFHRFLGNRDLVEEFSKFSKCSEEFQEQILRFFIPIWAEGDRK